MKTNFIKYFVVVLILLSMTIFFAASPASASNLEDGISIFYQGNHNEAVKKFDAAISENPYDTLSMLYILDCYEKNNDLSSVSNKFEQQAVSKSDDALAQANLGFAYFARSLINSTFESEALEQFKKAIKLDQKLSSAYTGMGLVYYQKRMMPRAKGYFYKALQLNPNDIIASEKIGEILLVDEKKPDEAIVYFKKIAEILPSYPDAYYYIGSSFYDLNDYPNAIEMLNKCTQLDPKGMTQGHYAPQLIGDIYLKQKMYKEAIAAFEHALKINPQNSYAKYKLEKAKNPGKDDKKPK